MPDSVIRRRNVQVVVQHPHNSHSMFCRNENRSFSPRSLSRILSVVMSSSTSAARQWPVDKCLNLNNEFQCPAPPRHGSCWTTWRDYLVFRTLALPASSLLPQPPTEPWMTWQKPRMFLLSDVRRHSVFSCIRPLSGIFLVLRGRAEQRHRLSECSQRSLCAPGRD